MALKSYLLRGALPMTSLLLHALIREKWSRASFICVFIHTHLLSGLFLTWETRHAKLTIIIAQASVWRQQCCTHTEREFLTHGKSFAIIHPAATMQGLDLMNRLDNKTCGISNCFLFEVMDLQVPPCIFLFHVHMLPAWLVNEGGLQHEEWHMLLRSFIYLSGKYGVPIFDQLAWVLLFHLWPFVCTLNAKILLPFSRIICFSTAGWNTIHHSAYYTVLWHC